MQYTYERDISVSYSETDQNFNLSPFAAFSVTQTVLTEYFFTIHTDNETLARESNAAWVLSRMRLHIAHWPRLKDQLHAKCAAVKLKTVRLVAETAYTDEQGSTVMTASQELCPIDRDARTVRRISSVSFPNDMECSDPVTDGEFPRLTREFAQEELAYTRTALASEIDFTRHVNNCMYVRYFVDARPTAFWDAHEMSDLYIYFIHEVHEGAALEIFAAETESGMEFLLRSDGVDSARALMKFKK